MPAARVKNGSKTQPINITSKSVGVLFPAINKSARETAAPMMAAAVPTILKSATVYETAFLVLAAVETLGIGTSIDTSCRYCSYASP